jgi:hypothetical protein
MRQLRGRYCTILSLEFGIPMKLVRLIKMCLNETCINVSDTYPVQNGVREKDDFVRWD